MLFKTVLVILLYVSGVLGQNGWRVTYTPETICGLKGSSVDMRCSYLYPKSHTVQKTFWFIHQNPIPELDDLSLDPEYSDRVEYLGNKKNNCTFRINQLRESDREAYHFRFLTNREDSRYTGRPGLTLEVTALRVIMYPDTVTEGQSVTLTCSTTCTLTGLPAFTWYRDRSPLSFTTQTHQLTASSEDGGRYSCAVKGYGHLPSPAVALTVNYPPQGTTVSFSGEIVEGSSVTLTCSSDANPPVNRYTWLKGNRTVSSATGGPEASYTIKHITRQDSGEYYCEAGNWIGTHRSPPKLLDVQYSPKNTSVSVSPSGEIVEGISVTLTCSSDANPPVQNYTWFKEKRAVSSRRKSGLNHTITNILSQESGQYYCEVQNQVGTQNSTTETINVQYPPKNTSVSVSPSGEIVEGSSVTLTCSSDANPPVQNYTWFKKNETGVWQAGSGQSLTLSNFRSWNSGHYYCVSENKHGPQNSTALLATVQGGQIVAVAAAVGVGAIVALVFLGVVWVRRRKSTNVTVHTEGDREGNKGPIYSNVSGTPMSHTETLCTDRGNGEVPLYSSVQPSNTHNQVELLYSTVCCPQSEDEVQYASVQFLPSGAGPRPPASTVTEDCVLYSTVRKHQT
ncbi:B-cell receptor CD22-like isoform X2 [Conger conger]|uniref:B-cell receptor CD22-like isoform X2 n=1 Tax=Conger conger TaxID=82655 RepID=UPI002A5B0CEB|nr:B-cell receptor CD22-like isoform X2 [Conger conger]